MFNIDVQHTRYNRNPHVRLDGKVRGRTYDMQIAFKDHKEKQQVFALKYDADMLAQLAERFGFPRAMMGSGRLTQAQMQRWLAERDQALQNGLFLMRGQTVEPDPSAVVSYYADPVCRPIAEQIVTALNRYETDTRRDRIEMAMRFVQDIPYGIPHKNHPEKMHAGVLTPPEILYHGFGDCDSKSFLFASILVHLIDPKDVLFLRVPGHMLTAVRAEPASGNAILKYKGHSYLVAETAGPGRIPLGKPGRHFKGQAKVDPLQYKPSSDPLPTGRQSNAGGTRYNPMRAPRKAVASGFTTQLQRLRKRKTRIKSLVFNDGGGWLILAGKNEYYAEHIPQPLLDQLASIKKRGFEITDVALSDDDAFVIIYHNGFGYQTSLFEETGNTLLPALNQITEKHGQPIRDVVFTHRYKGGWAILFGHNGSGFTCHTNPALLNQLQPALNRAARQGLKSLAFARGDGWVVLFGQSGFATSLPRTKNDALQQNLTLLAQNGATLDRIYLTATDDWVILYDGHHFKTSWA